jgi:hypothetical protein
MPLAALSRVTGEVEVVTKGGNEMQGKIDPRALGHVTSYLRLRPDTHRSALFVTETGQGDQLPGRPHDLAPHSEALGRQTRGQPPDSPFLRPRGEFSAAGA